LSDGPRVRVPLIDVAWLRVACSIIDERLPWLLLLPARDPEARTGDAEPDTLLCGGGTMVDGTTTVDAMAALFVGDTSVELPTAAPPPMAVRTRRCAAMGPLLPLPPWLPARRWADSPFAVSRDITVSLSAVREQLCSPIVVPQSMH
jgi:hypothetical protein